MAKRILTAELYTGIKNAPVSAIIELRTLNGLSAETLETLKDAANTREAALSVITNGDSACVGGGVYYMDKEYAQAFTAKSVERAKKIVAKAEATLSRYLDITAILPTDEEESKESAE